LKVSASIKSLHSGVWFNTAPNLRFELAAAQIKRRLQNEKLNGGRPGKIFLGLFFFAALSLSAQVTEIKDALYHVVSDGGGADASLIMRELELRFEVYNRLFGFDDSALDAPLRVRAFGNKADYDAYILARLGNPRDGAVYLHYNRKEKRELVIHRGSPGEAAALPHQAFIQFLRAFVAEPPAWIRDGFAVFFSSLRFDPETGALDYTENLAWLEPVKNLGDKAPSLESVLLAGSQDAPDHFQPLAWSVVSFFLNNGKEIYSRILTEIFMTLATTQADAGAVMRRVTIRTDMETFRRDYRSYLAARKTFAELIRDGQAAYARKDPAAAELSFREAGSLNPRHYAPYYYLGLLAYEGSRYEAAEQYYRSAGQYGADPALVNFALGLNAAMAGQKAEAESFLEDAAQASPARFRRRADDMIQRFVAE
jgi:tetratricopeptide (TPR) repeat protein